MQKRKNHTGLIVALNVIALLIITAVCTAGIYSRYGGFGTGECADTEEFLKYADSISEIAVPNETQIVALGEAAHGNKEFQQLRLDVFQVLVEKYGVRAFALEGDYRIPASGSPTPSTPVTLLPRHRKNAVSMSASWISPRCRKALHLRSISQMTFQWVPWVNPTAF